MVQPGGASASGGKRGGGPEAGRHTRSQWGQSEGSAGEMGRATPKRLHGRGAESSWGGRELFRNQGGGVRSAGERSREIERETRVLPRARGGKRPRRGRRPRRECLWRRRRRRWRPREGFRRPPRRPCSARTGRTRATSGVQRGRRGERPSRARWRPGAQLSLTLSLTLSREKKKKRAQVRVCAVT